MYQCYDCPSDRSLFKKAISPHSAMHIGRSCMLPFEVACHWGYLARQDSARMTRASTRRSLLIFVGSTRHHTPALLSSSCLTATEQSASSLASVWKPLALRTLESFTAGLA